VEDAGATVKNTVMGPIQQATAVIRGIKTGIDVLRSFRRPGNGSAAPPSDSSDEGLFI
jgi:hypothetical protein